MRPPKIGFRFLIYTPKNYLKKHGLKGVATCRKKKISKKYNIGVIDLKFTQYIPMMVSDIVCKWKSDQTSMTSLWRLYIIMTSYVSMTSIIEIEIWNLV